MTQLSVIVFVGFSLLSIGGNLLEPDIVSRHENCLGVICLVVVLRDLFLGCANLGKCK